MYCAVQSTYQSTRLPYGKLKFPFGLLLHRSRACEHDHDDAALTSNPNAQTPNPNVNPNVNPQTLTPERSEVKNSDNGVVRAGQN